jgi:5'(3')-deoxyribonucleotidase
MKKCLLDLDGVLVDFLEGVYKLHGKIEGDLVGHDIHLKYGMSEAEFWDPMGHDFWANLSFLPDGIAILEQVEHYFGVNNICVLTSPLRNPDSLSGKLEWIQTNLPKYRRSYLIGPRKEFCANETHILIDDFEHNVDRFRQHGGTAFLVPRPWNRDKDKEQYLTEYLIEFLETL